jgi:hypothetical protein
MEKRSNSFYQHTGKRAVSTALPACRQHGANRDHSEENRASKVAQEYSLGPIQLTKVNQNRITISKINNPLRRQYKIDKNDVNNINDKGEEDEVKKQKMMIEGKEKVERVNHIIMDQQSYHEARPDSRYNQESICTSLDAMAHKVQRPQILTSWNKDRRTEYGKGFLNNGKITGKQVIEKPNAILKMYGQF